MEYKSILLVEQDDELDLTHVEQLNEYFEDGWEYAGNISQTITSSSFYVGGVIVILKKETIQL